MNRRRWSWPIEGMKSCLEKVCFKVAPKQLNVSDERIESDREFQIVGAPAWKQRKPKVRVERGTCGTLEKEFDLRTREGR